ncbi:TIGR04104 family putative zinc finger protein [Alkalicoccus chagannorensis]|uniref:TIGR04104 family putative zinc finger protein n=1 Tax=Alkalicoccus chagannorensis TaxID=427072 RepID=UPI0003F9B5BD|nr:TIGR04104 family putative zinc finger protein [Alkalicoccus chagannorensis]
MKLPTCTNCDHALTYTEALKVPITRRCPDCGERQYATRESNVKTVVPVLLLIGLPMVLLRFVLDMTVTGEFLLYTGAAVFFFVITVMVLPFRVTLTSKREALF